MKQKGSSQTPPGSETFCIICKVNYKRKEEYSQHKLLKHTADKKKEFELIGLRNEVENALNHCPAGEELSTILNVYCVDDGKVQESFTKVCNSIRKSIPYLGDIYLFGSASMGLAIKDSDLDISIPIEYDSELQFRQKFNKMTRLLSRTNEFSKVIPIKHARIPIIKLQHAETGCNTDISMTNTNPVLIANFIRDLLLMDNRWLQLMRFVIICFKTWDIIGSYNFRTCSVHALVIFYLQNLKNTPEGNFIVPPIQVLQSCTEPKCHNGVNFAYDLKQIQPMGAHHDVPSLIKGFFLFYSEFDFANYIVSPFLGKAIPKDKFISEEFIFEAYNAQLRELTLLNGVPPEPMKANLCISIQDFFSLNILYNSSVTESGVNYFRLCINSAVHIFTDSDIISDSQLYQKLLYGLIDRISNGNAPTAISIEPFSCNIKPNLMRVLYRPVEHVKCLDIECLRKLWVKVIVEIVHEVLTDLFKLDVEQSTAERTSPKIEKLESDVYTLNWILNGAVDVWSGRNQLEKKATNYLDRLKMQANTLEKQRRQNSTFAVKLHAVLKVRIQNDSTIEMKIQPMDSNLANLTKKSPLRKMFGNFCNIMNAVTLLVEQKMEKISETELTNIIQSLKGNSVVEFNFNNHEVTT